MLNFPLCYVNTLCLVYRAYIANEKKRQKVRIIFHAKCFLRITAPPLSLSTPFLPHKCSTYLSAVEPPSGDLVSWFLLIIELIFCLKAFELAWFLMLTHLVFNFLCNNYLSIFINILIPPFLQPPYPPSGDMTRGRIDYNTLIPPLYLPLYPRSLQNPIWTPVKSLTLPT